ncbi:transcription termination factor Rho [Dermacoccus nishinomiyaensis]|uniref:transcription termination factor Rho n=1 Tax=Dermacoccus nishinomiyaensis TaxID=1274 RepID=UPI0021A4C9B1|nr:transcription termination factor Rho [Dermacoccus nishinomiyaensis]MCT1605161.1 transcription termination factor Rho [Dermacoccus nishinomiyaensis]
MRLDELKQLAQSMGIPGISKMRKVDLVTAIRAARAEANGVGGSRAKAAGVTSTAPTARRATSEQAEAAPSATEAPRREQGDAPAPQDDEPGRATRDAGAREGDAASREGERSTRDEQEQPREQRTRRGRRGGEERKRASENSGSDQGDAQREGAAQDTGSENDADGKTVDGKTVDGKNVDAKDDASNGESRGRRDGERDERRQRRENGSNEPSGDKNSDGDARRERRDNSDSASGENGRDKRDNRDSGNNSGNGGSNRRERNNERNHNNDDDERGGRRRRQRGRDRDRDRGERGNNRRGRNRDYDDDAPEVREDDVLIPVAGIVDVLDNYAFVRTTGYLAGPTDVYVPMNIVKKNGLRKGDAVTGAVRALREGEQLPARQKFNALVRLDSVNGMTVEQAKKRVEFGKLTPLYPQERLRLETTPNVLTTRMIDLVSPVGKGQRGLIVAPAKAGKTMVMQSIANAITTNNPECHLMVVLVDERPEEVTDMQRAVKGEVIASTFDRPATDHTTVAELAIERAKRLVEMGHDVVVLLDSITKLGRAYNLAAPASGRILSGGVDSAALYPPKKFFGAARNIENGGSLTILATALVETGSKMDEVIFEEFKGTGNMELKLDRQLANRRIFPAVDVNNSSTRREEILLSGEELKIMWKLRRVLAALDQQQAVELLIDRLKKTKSNVEFLMQVQQTSNIKLDDEDN